MMTPIKNDKAFGHEIIDKSFIGKFDEENHQDDLNKSSVNYKNRSQVRSIEKSANTSRMEEDAGRKARYLDAMKQKQELEKKLELLNKQMKNYSTLMDPDVKSVEKKDNIRGVLLQKKIKVYFIKNLIFFSNH